MNQFVPRSYDVAGTALLVALYLNEKEAGNDVTGMTKEELYMKGKCELTPEIHSDQCHSDTMAAESLDITKNPFSGGTTQTGTQR